MQFPLRSVLWSCLLSVQDGNAVNFRYVVKPKSRVSAFEPNGVDGDPLALRDTTLGAVMKENLNRLPKSKMGSILWEVIISILCRFEH